MRKIIHIDMDCFYAAVEMHDDPSLQGKPVIVGGTTDRGVVCAASYEARKYGVRSAMPLFRARSLCKNGIYLPVRMSRYVEVSKVIKDIFFRYTDLVQSISLDEAFLDVTKNKFDEPYAMEIAKRIKVDILNETGLIASAGIAPNKFLAKIASDYKKPNGFFVIRPNEVEDFMIDLPVKKIWGVGRVMAQKLDELGVKVAGDISKLTPDFLSEKFGKWGPHLLQLSKGVDHSEVVPYRDPKSIGNETTFRENIQDREEIEKTFVRMCKKISERLKKKKVLCKGVQIKIKYDDFQLITRSAMMSAYSDDALSINEIATKLLDKTEVGDRPVRLAGISVHHFEHATGQEDLFSLLG